MEVKIAAALSRQHPRDIFDCKYMKETTFERIKNGLILCLLGSDKPIIESLCPNEVNQKEILNNQFLGMTDIPFSYSDYRITRQDIIRMVNACLNKDDKTFLLSFEQGTPIWNYCSAGNLSSFPSVQWKLQNIIKLKEQNPKKFQIGIEKLSTYFDEGYSIE